MPVSEVVCQNRAGNIGNASAYWNIEYVGTDEVQFTGIMLFNYKKQRHWKFICINRASYIELVY